MKDELSKEEVLHVAHLARIYLSDDEIKKFQVSLKKLLDDVEKINEVENYDEELMFSPITHKATMRQDIEKGTINFDLVKKNIPHTKGNFIETQVMINE